MLVKELIARLKTMDPDTEVVALANYGDRSGTMQAIDIDDVQYETLTQSSYSDSGWALDNNADDDDEVREVVALS